MEDAVPYLRAQAVGHDDVDAASKLAGETIMTARKVEEAEPRLRINLDEDIDIAFGRGVSIGVQS